MSPFFAEINRYFDHVYVLTLPEAKERQDSIKKLLNGLHWSFFEGTNKKDIASGKISKEQVYDDALHLRTKRTSRSMNLGEIACAISHVRMYQDMLHNKFQRVLILEDDVLPLNQTVDDFKELIAELPADWDVLMMGYYGHKLPSLKSKAQREFYRVCKKLSLFKWQNVSDAWIDNICMREYSNRLYKAGKVLGTHAYAINANAAQKFIDYQSPVKVQADRVFNYYQSEHGLKLFACKQVAFTLSELSKESFIK